MRPRGSYRYAAFLAIAAGFVLMPLMAASSPKFTPKPGDISKLRPELQAALKNTGLVAANSDECAVFVYRPEEAAKVYDQEFYRPNRLTGAFAITSLRAVVLWDKLKRGAGSAVVYHYSVVPSDYTMTRTYDKGTAVRGTDDVINIAMDPHLAYPTSSVGLGSDPIRTLPPGADKFDRYYIFEPYTVTDERTAQEAERECMTPQSGESQQECFCVGTVERGMVSRRH